MNKKIAVLVGSLRKASINRKVAKKLISIAPESVKFEIVEIDDLPLYNQDLDDEGNPPAAWTTFRDKMKTYDGFLFVTPEYNRSVPGALKNAVDVGSRPYGQSVWAGGKPGAVASVSPSPIGGFGANQHLRQSLGCLNVMLLQQPEFYVGNAGDLFDAKGELTKESTGKFLQQFMDAFVNWIGVVSKN